MFLQRLKVKVYLRRLYPSDRPTHPRQNKNILVKSLFKAFLLLNLLSIFPKVTIHTLLLITQTTLFCVLIMKLFPENMKNSTDMEVISWSMRVSEKQISMFLLEPGMGANTDQLETKYS